MFEKLETYANRKSKKFQQRYLQNRRIDRQRV